MWIDIAFTQGPIQRPQIWNVPFDPETGALVEFYGIVRETEGAGKFRPCVMRPMLPWRKK
jgi:molybdopterin synthase catalytic subunit